MSFFGIQIPSGSAACISIVLRAALGFNQKAGGLIRCIMHISSETLRGPSAFQLYRLDKDLSGEPVLVTLFFPFLFKCDS